MSTFCGVTRNILMNTAGLCDSVGCTSDWWSGGCGFSTCRVGNNDHSKYFMINLQERMLWTRRGRPCTYWTKTHTCTYEMCQLPLSCIYLWKVITCLPFLIRNGYICYYFDVQTWFTNSHYIWIHCHVMLNAVLHQGYATRRFVSLWPENICLQSQVVSLTLSPLVVTFVVCW